MTDMIIGVLEWLAGMITTYVPAIRLDGGIMGNVAEGIAYMLDVFASTNWIFPVPDALAIIGIMFGFRLLKVAVFAFNWVIRRILDIIPG